MHRSSRIVARSLFAAAACAFFAGSLFAQVSVRTVKVLGSKEAVEVEVEASDRITPETQVLTGPDRLVVDFPNAIPGNKLRNQSIDRGEVKDVRVGLFQSRPPITRVVVDLKSARSFQVFPSGRTVMIKVLGDAPASVADNSAQSSGTTLIATNYASIQPAAPAPPLPPLQVLYRDGLLSVHANKVPLSEVLYAIQQRSGADISIPAGAEQDKVVADILPAPAAEVLARLLNGSRFNFLILNSADDTRQLDRVILTTRGEVGNYVPPPPQPVSEDSSADDQPVPPPLAPGQSPADQGPLTQAEQQPPTPENPQDQ